MSTYRSPRVGISPSYAMTQRVQRRPQHKFNLRFQPYQIQPTMIAPVLPGETLKTVMLQSQCWSTPLKPFTLRNIGWWQEFHYFYVKHRDLIEFTDGVEEPGLRDKLIKMFTDGTPLTADAEVADNATWYTPKGGVNFLKLAVDRIVDEYFRDDGESSSDYTYGGLPLAKIYGKGQSDWSEKLTMDDDYEDNRVAVPEYLNDMEKAYIEWAAMKDAGLMDMDYEDWMRTYGVNPVVPEEERITHHVPEDLAHFREFAYPTNTVEPSNGQPATAIGWRTASRSNKSFLFQEPGWIIGLVVVRPKVYLGNQKGNVASMMITRESWLPAILNNELDVSHLKLPGTHGPLNGTIPNEDEYWIDLRDLLNYGDQFTNIARTDAPFVALPDVNANRRYPSQTDIEKFFLSAANSEYQNGFEIDGVHSLVIVGRQQERYKNLTLGQA